MTWGCADGRCVDRSQGPDGVPPAQPAGSEIGDGGSRVAKRSLRARIAPNGASGSAAGGLAPSLPRGGCRLGRWSLRGGCRAGQRRGATHHLCEWAALSASRGDGEVGEQRKAGNVFLWIDSTGAWDDPNNKVYPCTSTSCGSALATTRTTAAFTDEYSSRSLSEVIHPPHLQKHTEDAIKGVSTIRG